LDGSRDHRATLDRQEGVLRDLLQLCARAGGRVITLHSRGAAGAVLDALKVAPGAGAFVLHWYLGSSRQITRAAEMGCWFSVGPAMLSSARGAAAVTAMPRNRVLPESDGPFGTMKGRPMYPWDAWSVVPQLAQLWKEPELQVETRLLAAFKQIANLSAGGSIIGHRNQSPSRPAPAAGACEHAIHGPEGTGDGAATDPAPSSMRAVAGIRHFLGGADAPSGTPRVRALSSGSVSQRTRIGPSAWAGQRAG
jgi:hypothetical protein